MMRRPRRGRDLDRGANGRKTLVTPYLDLAPQRLNPRIAHASIGEVLDPDLTEDQCGCDRMLHAHLRLAPRRNVWPVGADGQQRISRYRDTDDLGIGVIAPPIQHAI